MTGATAVPARVRNRRSRWMRRTAAVLALLAVAFSYVGSTWILLDYKPGGAVFDSQVRPAVTAVFVVALVIAVFKEHLGGGLAVFAASALLVFAGRQLVAPQAALVVALFLVPAVLWIAAEVEAVRGRTLLTLAAIGVAGLTGYGAGMWLYDYGYGPKHPQSSRAPLPDSEIDWVWSGGVTTDHAEVRARPSVDWTRARLAVATDEALTEPQWFDAANSAGAVVGFELTGLAPDTTYHYAVEVDGRLDRVRQGRLQTFPAGPASFTVAVGGCARVGSNGQVFEAIREADPLLYLILGDLHYGDNGRNDIERYRQVMDLTLSRPAQAALYRSAPVAYMWDDHDYGGNDVDASYVGRQAAMAAYREYAPDYGLAGDESAIYQAFSIGRVRFIVTDSRSARDVENTSDDGYDTMLGAEQKAWLLQELLAARDSAALTVWANPDPWIADAQPGADTWGGYADERAEIADFIADNGIDNLVMVSGDAHMVAIDDGTNTDYSAGGGVGFPLLHVAALDRQGSYKGGPYSMGAIPGAGHFGQIDVHDDGTTISVDLRAMSYTGEELMSLTWSPAARPGDGQGP